MNLSNPFKTTLVVGAQWGDEGKGKVVDMLAEHKKATVRFQGGHNAGHTLVVDGQKIVLHLTPSGILHPSNQSYIGHGVVFHPDSFLKEVQSLKGNGIEVAGRLWVSELCPLLLDSHIVLDQAREKHSQSNQGTIIGTTCRGIGPCYEDKVARRGLKLKDLYHPDLKEKYEQLLDFHNFQLTHYYHTQAVDTLKSLENLEALKSKLKPFLTSVSPLLNNHLDQGDSVLFEGAQGVLLDIDQGTYPFVTSSNTTSGSVFTGTGLGLRKIDCVLGVFKAYTTRVGEGPFPTELNNKTGEYLGEKGGEFGATTGRKRRCGWLDLAALKHAISVCGITHLAMTKLDVLDDLDEVVVATSYKQGLSFNQIDQTTQATYQTFKGWKTSISDTHKFDDLPTEAKNLIRFIESEVGLSIALISTGPNRHQTILTQAL